MINFTAWNPPKFDVKSTWLFSQRIHYFMVKDMKSVNVVSNFSENYYVNELFDIYSEHFFRWISCEYMRKISCELMWVHLKFMWKSFHPTFTWISGERLFMWGYFARVQRYLDTLRSIQSYVTCRSSIQCAAISM